MSEEETDVLKINDDDDHDDDDHVQYWYIFNIYLIIVIKFQIFFNIATLTFKTLHPVGLLAKFCGKFKTFQTFQWSLVK